VPAQSTSAYLPNSVSGRRRPDRSNVTHLFASCATVRSQIWLIEAWMGSPINVAPDEHDAIAWFTEDALGGLSLAHDSYLAIFSKVLAEHRA
jgi:hypothetical protein